MRIFLTFALILGATPALAQAQRTGLAPLPTYEVHRAGTAPHIDGRLDEAAWQAAKVGVPLWYGCMHVLVRAPRRAVGTAREDGRLGVPPG